MPEKNKDAIHLHLMKMKLESGADISNNKVTVEFTPPQPPPKKDTEKSQNVKIDLITNIYVLNISLLLLLFSQHSLATIISKK